VKYYLVDKGDNILDKVELGSGVGMSGAKTFFIGRKRIDEKEFDNMWRVMSSMDYDRKFHLANKQNKQHEWWKDDGYLDIDVDER